MMLKQIDFHGLPPTAAGRTLSRARRPDAATCDEAARNTACHRFDATA
jgi:hypothetical protein